MSYSSWRLTSIERLIEIKHKFENRQRLLNEKFGSELKNYKIFGQSLDTLRKLAHEPPHDVLMSYGVLLMKLLVCELCNEIIEKFEHICACSRLHFGLEHNLAGKTRHDISWSTSSSPAK